MYMIPEANKIVIAYITKVCNQMVYMSLLQYNGVQATISLQNVSNMTIYRLLNSCLSGKIIMCKAQDIYFLPSGNEKNIVVDCKYLNGRFENEFILLSFIEKFERASEFWLNVIMLSFDITCEDVSRYIAKLACENFRPCISDHEYDFYKRFRTKC